VSAVDEKLALTAMHQRRLMYLGPMPEFVPGARRVRAHAHTARRNVRRSTGPILHQLDPRLARTSHLAVTLEPDQFVIVTGWRR
jgi:hypothetical protein